jgi:phosphoserine aminotransferase
MEHRVYNFSAGPAGLPDAVIEKAQQELLVYPGAGASIMEISHRGKIFSEIHERTKANIRQLLNLPDNYHVLFTPGGATMQFAAVPMNLMGVRPADFVHSGVWADKAMKEAAKFGEVRTAWTGKDGNFNRMPKQDELEIREDAAYFHFTSNETIQGIELFVEPETGDVPLICDASSDFLSRPIDITKYAVLYAGAQKNVGPSGMAVLILRDDMLERVPEKLPALIDYKNMAEKDSLYNTPPTFTIYMVGLATDWLLNEIGGLEAVEKRNREKAQLLYDAIDNSGGFYKGHAKKESRSLMNVTFTLAESALEAEFVKEAEAEGMHALKGHRSVGGCRASIYNAMPVAGCKALAGFMAAFQQKHG